MSAVLKAPHTSGAGDPAFKSFSALATWSFLLVHENAKLSYPSPPVSCDTFMRLTSLGFRALFQCPPFNNPPREVRVNRQLKSI